MTKFAILGYGKMGKEVEKVILAGGDEIVAKIDNDEDWQQQWQQFLTADVAVEFSMPQVAIDNFKKCFDQHIPLVAGTTGWYDQMEFVLNYCRKTSNNFIFGSNFSIGVNVFFKINELLAEMMRNQSGFTLKIEETHHITKKDAPSGTALQLAKIIKSQLGENQDVEIESFRLTDVPGIHKVMYQFENETIELTHTAKNRVELARGAVRAAHWLLAHPGVYDFKEVAMELVSSE